MTTYIYDMTDTWDDAGVVWSAIKMNVTDTASAEGSNILDLQLDGNSLLTFGADGKLSIAGSSPTSGILGTVQADISAGGGTYVDGVTAAVTGQIQAQSSVDTANYHTFAGVAAYVYRDVGAADTGYVRGLTGVDAYASNYGTSDASFTNSVSGVAAMGDAGFTTGSVFGGDFSAFAYSASETPATVANAYGISSYVDASGANTYLAAAVVFDISSDATYTYGLYSESYAPNFLQGNLAIGYVSPTVTNNYALYVYGTTGLNPGANATPQDLGDVVFELTSNTLLKIKAKGSDGVVRSVSLTLT